MNVFSIQPDFDRFNLLVAAGAPSTLDQMTDTPIGVKINSHWKGIQLCDRTPADEDYRGPLPMGDFSGLVLSRIGATMPVLKKLGHQFEESGEFLPVHYRAAPIRFTGTTAPRSLMR
jgi:hypothetical protein